MANKCDSKDNLVTSSMMLVNNSDNIQSYDPGAPYPSHSGASSNEDMAWYQEHYIPHAGPFSYGTYNPYPYNHMDTVITTARNCTCKHVPMQDTFLHQILSGKGYKNAQLYVSVRPVVKQERVYHDYCCYGYPVGYRYAAYH